MNQRRVKAMRFLNKQKQLIELNAINSFVLQTQALPLLSRVKVACKIIFKK